MWGGEDGGAREPRRPRRQETPEQSALAHVAIIVVTRLSSATRTMADRMFVFCLISFFFFHGASYTRPGHQESSSPAPSLQPCGVRRRGGEKIKRKRQRGRAKEEKNKRKGGKRRREKKRRSSNNATTRTQTGGEKKRKRKKEEGEGGTKSNYGRPPFPLHPLPSLPPPLPSSFHQQHFRLIDGSSK
jgi:hypothetical protein